MPAEMARTGLRAPVNVTWEVTLKCNLRCTHCLSDAGSESAEELSTSECRKLIDDLAAFKVFQINIGGGEPFIRDDFLELLDRAHDRGLVTCVSSNGLLIDRALARRLAGMEMFYLQVSLDGATAEVNDSIRGRGTYDRVLTAMGNLVGEGVRFSINTVLTRLNFPQLETLRSLAREYGSELRVSRFRPSGRGKDSRASLAPETEQLEAFAEWLERHDRVRTGDSFFCLTSEKRRRQGLDMCGAAKMTCCLSPTGRLYPCAFLQEPAFLAGEFRTGSFKDLWGHSPVFAQLRHLNVKACRTCPRFEDCRGGCPAVAYHTHRDIARPDPECLINLRTAA